MTGAAWFGFGGDFSAFLGGVILALDALDAERKFQKFREWKKTIEDPELEGVILTLRGVRLRSGEDVELSFIRKSAKLALGGTLFLAIGFVALFVSRCLEIRGSEHGIPNALTSAASEIPSIGISENAYTGRGSR
jgi:hypothetical protein